MSYPVPQLHLRGSPRERGLQHGEELSSKIHDLLGGWRYAIEKTTETTIEKWVADFVANTRFLELTQRHAPDLVTEIQGIAEAAAVPFEELFMFNCTDENQWFLEYRGFNLSLPGAKGCTSLGNTTDKKHLLAQNLDIPGATDGFEVLLHIDDGETQSHVFSIAGVIGMIGLNNHGFGLVNNSMKQLNPRVDGWPVTMVVRELLKHRTMQSASNWIQSVPHATGQNWILGGIDGIAMFECSANEVAEVHAVDGNNWLHTNHPLVTQDLNQDERFLGNRSGSNTHVRFETLVNSYRSCAGDVENVKALLSSQDPADSPICREITSKGSSFTAASVVYELSESPVMHIAAGPPCRTPFETFGFD